MSIIFSTAAAAATKLCPLFPTYHKISPSRNPILRNWSLKSRKQTLCSNSLKSEIYTNDKFSKVGALSNGPIQPDHLIQVATIAAQTGAQVLFFFPFCIIRFELNEIDKEIISYGIVDQLIDEMFILFE
jgi:hypothetical protein